MAMVRWCSIRCSRAKMLIIWIHLVLVGPISNFRFLSQSFLWNYLNYFLHFKCLEPHLLKLYWKSMELVQVSQLQVTVSRLLIEWVCLVMYLRREVSPIRTFPSLSYAPEYPPYEDGKIISLCNSQTEICSKYFCFLLTLPMSLTKIVLFVLGDWIARAWFSIHCCRGCRHTEKIVYFYDTRLSQWCRALHNKYILILKLFNVAVHRIIEKNL